jgi:hypothetical protein
MIVMHYKLVKYKITQNERIERERIKSAIIKYGMLFIPADRYYIGSEKL